jgi:hypothetical protein
MQSAKDEVQSISTIARSSVGRQAFMSVSPPFSARPSGLSTVTLVGTNLRVEPLVAIALMEDIAPTDQVDPAAANGTNALVAR